MRHSETWWCNDVAVAVYRMRVCLPYGKEVATREMEDSTMRLKRMQGDL